MRRLATKITRERERENNKEGRGIITAISRNRDSSRLNVFDILKRSHFFLHLHTFVLNQSKPSILDAEFSEVCRFSLVVYSQFPADCAQFYLCLHGRPSHSTHSVFRGIFLSWPTRASDERDDTRRQLRERSKRRLSKRDYFKAASALSRG